MIMSVWTSRTRTECNYELNYNCDGSNVNYVFNDCRNVPIIGENETLEANTGK